MHELGQAVVASGKPVAVLKLGKSDVGQRASLSHTGAMSGSADVYRGFFRQYGLIEVADVPHPSARSTTTAGGDDAAFQASLSEGAGRLEAAVDGRFGDGEKVARGNGRVRRAPRGELRWG